jgi:hypothetical protein
VEETTQEETTQTVTVPLDRAPSPSDESIQIRFETGLRAERPCLASRLYRLAISSQSTVSYRYAQSSLGIQDFFPPFLRQVTYYVPSPLTEESAQTALWLSTYLARKYPENPSLRIRTRPDSIGQALTSGAWSRAVIWDEKHSASVMRKRIGGTDTTRKSRRYRIQPSDVSLANIARRFYGRASAWRRIYAANESQITDPRSIEPGQRIRLPGIPTEAVGAQGTGEPRGTNGPKREAIALALGSEKAARQLFVSENGIDIAAAQALVADTTQLQSPKEFGERVGISQLGFGTRQVEGTGKMSIPYNFSLGDLGDQRYPTGLRLRVPHTPLPEGGQGHLKVLLNGNQVMTTALGETGTPVDDFIELPRAFLSRDVSLEVAFDYVAPSGNCSTSPLMLSAQVDPRSSLVLEEGWVPSPGFGRFPQAFVSGFGAYMPDLTRPALSRATQVASALQQTTRQSLFPGVYTENAPSSGDFLALGSRGLEKGLGAPVQSSGIRVLSGSGEPVLSFRPESPQAMLQGFENDGQNVLLLTHSSGSGALADSLLSSVLAPDGWFGVSGDFATQGQQGPARTLQVQETDLEVQPFGSSSEAFLQKYRIWLFTGGAIAVLIFLIYTYPKLVRDEPSAT